jgi:hypothetical protein
MVRTRSRDPVHNGPRRLCAVAALLLAFSTALLVAACGGGSGASQGVGGETSAPGETMGSETTAPSSGY